MGERNDVGTQVSAGVVGYCCGTEGWNQPPMIGEPMNGSTAKAMKRSVR